MMDIRDFLFPAVVPSSLRLSLSQAPFDIGKVEAVAAAFHFPFARGPTLLLSSPAPLAPKLTPVEGERQSISDRHGGMRVPTR